MLHLIWYIIVGFLAGCVAKSAVAHASVDHVDSCTGDCRLDYWRSSNASVLSAQRWRPISSKRHNRFHSRSDSSPLSLAQVSPANTAGLGNQGTTAS
jgi:hypothetical protein